MKTKEIASVLCELAEFIKDGDLGYKKAAENTKDESFKKFCLEHSKKRANFLKEVNQFITENGGKEEESGTVKGTIFRNWMDVKSTLLNTTDKGMIESSIFGEEWAQKAYVNALNHDLPENVKAVLQHQKLISENAIRDMEALKFFYKTSDSK